MIKLTPSQIESLIRDGEFPLEVRASKPNVAIILTQSWCSDWNNIRNFITKGSFGSETEIFYTEYDLESYFDTLKEYKETTLQSVEIPYIRYYNLGKITSFSHVVDEGAFTRRLNRKIK